MLKKNILFFVFCACSFVLKTNCSEVIDDEFLPRGEITISIIQDEEPPEQISGWNGFCNKHVPFLLLTSAIGIITGTISASIENRNVFPWPISWLLLWGTRNIAVQTFIQDMKIYKIPYNKKLAFISARLADWIAYLFCKTAYMPQVR